jgi:hypothetical protein
MENNFSKVKGFKFSIFFPFGALVGLIGILLFWGCEKNDNPRTERRVEGKLSFLDVMDARALIIGGVDNKKKSGGLFVDQNDNSLFKITEDGVVQEIRYWQIDTIYIETDKGTEIQIDSIEVTSTIYPVNIFDADENHLIVSFQEEKEGDPHHPYLYDFLVRKSDGAVFGLLPGFGPDTPHWGHYNQMFRNEGNSVLIQRDDAGYIYYVGKGDIMKLSTQNPENVTMHQLTTGGHTGEGVMNYRVNGLGHIIFNSGGISSEGSTRIRFSNGGLAYPEKSLKPFWRGFDNNFYFSYTPQYEAGKVILPVVERITIDNGAVNYHRIGEVDHPSAELTYMANSYIFKMRNLNKIVAMEFSDHMGIDGKVVAEVYNPEMAIKAFAMSELGITQVKIGISSDNYYYLSGMDGNQPVLLKVDASVFPHQAEHLVPRGSYDVYKMVVTSDDYVMIHALRMADGNDVISQISPTGVITQLQDIGTEVIQLVRIR